MSSPVTINSTFSDENKENSNESTDEEVHADTNTTRKLSIKLMSTNILSET